MKAESPKSVERREFLRKAAITGAAAAWAAPLVQTVAATPAFAQTAGTQGPCFHSIQQSEGKLRGCMEACTGNGCQGNQCSPACIAACTPQGCGLANNQCCNDGLCVSSNWANCCYSGPTAGCSCSIPSC